MTIVLCGSIIKLWIDSYGVKWIGTKISTNDFNLNEKLKRNIFKINNNTYIVVIGDNEYLKDTLVQKFKIKQLKTEE